MGTPVEGTILTVIRAAAEAAEARAEQPGARARDVFTDAAAAAREALARTPDQLAVLRDAGVVDAGGRGLSVILDAAETVLTGRGPPPSPRPIGAHRIPIPTSGASDPDLTPEGPAYEVMYLLDADDDARTRPSSRPSPAWATRWSWSAATGSGTSTSTPTRSAPRSRPGSPPGVRTASG